MLCSGRAKKEGSFNMGTAKYNVAGPAGGAGEPQKYVARQPRVDAPGGGDGILIWFRSCQTLLEHHAPDGGTKTPRRALDLLTGRLRAIAFSTDVAQQMLNTPAVESAIEV